MHSISLSENQYYNRKPTPVSDVLWYVAEYFVVVLYEMVISLQNWPKLVIIIIIMWYLHYRNGPSSMIIGLTN